MIDPKENRQPKLGETDTGPIGWTEEELRPKAGEPDRLPPAPPFDASDIDVTIWMRIRHLWDTTMSKTTLIGMIQLALTTIAGILAKSGIDVVGGALVIASGTAPVIVVLTILVFLLSGVKSFLMQDRDGGTGITTWLGIGQVLTGSLATALLAMGVDVNDVTGVVSFDDLSSVPIIILYILWALCSAGVATYAKDRDDLPKLDPKMRIEGGA